MKTFKPLLAPNESVDLTTLQYPLLASNKLDGIRCIFKNGEILSRSLKQIQNKQLRERFEPIRKWTEQTGNIIDGEIYSPNLTFQEITHYVMTQDLYQPKVGTSKGLESLPDHLNFYAFDFLYGGQIHHPFQERIKALEEVIKQLKTPFIKLVEHEILNSEIEVQTHFQYALKEGVEGLMLRNPNASYKFGRGTIKEGIIYKVKPFVTFDAEIIGVVQSTEVREGAEKKVNELGRSVTSKKKDDRVLIDKASAFNVLYEGKELKVTLAMDDNEKTEVWKNREFYIGKTIEYKGMLVGSKDVPRHPVFLRFRTDKD